MSYFEDCYDKAITGDVTGLDELKSGADVGNEEAIHLLSCVYGNPSSPFWDEKLYKYWEGQKILMPKCTSEKSIDENITNKSWDEQLNGNRTPNRDFGTRNYCPNWTVFESIGEENVEESSSEMTDRKAEKPSLGTFLFSSEGRTSQSDYICFLCIWIVLWLIVGAAFYSTPSISIVGFLLFYPFIQITTKRCHDIGKYGMYILIPFYFIYLLFVSGDKCKNEYGFPPFDFFA